MAIVLPIEIGDTILAGRFKNRKVVVKTIGQDEYGHPTINGKKILNIRIKKFMDKKTTLVDEIIKQAVIEKKPTVKAINDYLKSKYPKYNIEFFKGKGYFYFMSDLPEEIQSISVYSLNQMPLSKWLSYVDSNIKDAINRS